MKGEKLDLFMANIYNYFSYIHHYYNPYSNKYELFNSNVLCLVEDQFNKPLDLYCNTRGPTRYDRANIYKELNSNTSNSLTLQNVNI